MAITLMKNIFIILLFVCFNSFGQNIPFNWFYAAKFGCKADGIIATGTVTAASPNIKIVGAGFLSRNPVGKKFRVQGGGAANVDQTLTCSSVLNDSVAVMSGNVTSSKTGTTIDYGTDNTSLIQSMFQTVTGLHGGKIIFDAGVYMIFGALQTSVNGTNPNSQIYFPLTQVNTAPICQLDIEGQYANQILSPIVSSAFGNYIQRCTVFKSEIDGSGTNPSIFGTPWYNNGYVPTVNYTSVSMTNVVVTTKSQVNNVDVAGTMGGINANYLNQFRIKTYVINTESILYNQANPTNSTYGIVFPIFLNNAVCEADFGIYSGYHWGAYISDHFYATQFTAVFCSYALKYENGSPGNINLVGHSATIEDLQVELCPNGIEVTGESSLYIQSWRGERQNAGWYATTGDDVHFSGSGLSSTVYIQQLDMTFNGDPDYAITTNAPKRLVIAYNNDRNVDIYPQTLTSGSTIAWDLIQGREGLLTLSGNGTLSFSNIAEGSNISLKVIQDGSGGHTLIPPSGSFTNDTTGLFALNTDASGVTLVQGYYINSVWNFISTPLYTTAGPAFRPSDLSGLKFWVAADSLTGLNDNDPVSTWTDLSGTGNTVTASTTIRPLYKTNVLNGKPVLRFDGTDDYMSKASPSSVDNTNGLTVFVVLKQASLAISKAVLGKWDYMTQGAWSLNTSDASNSNFQMFIANALNDNGNNFEASTNYGASSSSFSVLTVSYDGSQGTAANRTDFYNNGGVTAKSMNGTVAATLQSATAPLYVCNFGGSLLNTRNFGGDIAEIIIYNVHLSPTDRGQVETYLLTKWGLP